MDEDFLNEFFEELNGKVHNRQFVRELKSQIDELDKKSLEELIKRCF